MSLSKEDITIHAVGGCHIHGYPYGADKAFITLAANRLVEQPVQVLRLAPASFRKVDAYFDDPANQIEGQIVVVQMGNHESMTNSWRGQTLAEPAASSQNVDAAHMQSRLRAMPLVGWALDLVKVAVFLAREFSGHEFFQPEVFSARMNQTFAKIAARHPARVIVLSSLLANAPELNVCRRRLNLVLRDRTRDFGFDYVDAYEALDGANGRGGGSLFCDALHLSEQGQAVLGDTLAGPLQAAVRDLRQR